MRELEGIGFFDAGRHNRIPSNRLERHIGGLKKEYFGTDHERNYSSNIKIPGYYFVGNKNPKIIDLSKLNRKNLRAD